MNVIEWFFLFPIISGYIFDPKKQAQVNVIVPDRYLEGTTEQLNDSEMKDTVDKVLESFPKGHKRISAKNRMRDLAGETGMADLGYPIIMTGNKVHKILTGEVTKESFETRGQYPWTQGYGVKNSKK